jgi:WD40 repeat protein
MFKPILCTTALLALFFRGGVCDTAPPPPEPEKIVVSKLTLPPVVDSQKAGACTSDLNPNHTGCIYNATNLSGGGFTPDGTAVWASMDYAGAPSAPDTRSIYNGTHLVLLKADGSTFHNGDAWKCISCGVPEENGVINEDNDLTYPQAFRDGKRALAGVNIFDCSGFDFLSDECTPEQVHIYPIYWPNTANGSGPGGAIRELRIHPDGEHLGFSSFSGSGQYAYIGRITLNHSPTTGTPLTPRYDLSQVNLLSSPDRGSAITVDGGVLKIHHDAIVVGELRYLGGDGSEVGYLGYATESCNVDVYAVGLESGCVRRLTAHPEYVDPVDISPHDKWTAVMDTRGSNRQMWMSGMRNIPPIIDLVVSSAASSTRNNGLRRFFQPFIIDRYGDRGSYFGQKINGERGIPGSGDINDPEWNGRADPKWSLQGNRIAYWEAKTLSPACGGANPLPCYDSKEPGGRDRRMLVADLVDREPIEPGTPLPCPDVIPWATQYVPGSVPPSVNAVPAGEYILYGENSGYANVQIVEDSATSAVVSVSVSYSSFSDDGINVITGSEKVTTRPTDDLPYIEWYSNLTHTGDFTATKMTSPGGFNLTVNVFENIFQASGTLTTTIDGIVYHQPQNGT